VILEEKLVFNVMSVLAEHGRVKKKLLTRAALGQKIRDGKLIGTAPIGTQVAEDGKTLERNDIEAQAIELIKEERTKGLSIRAITEKLNLSGIPARGSKWHHQTVHRILKSIEV
tara:strand:- start:199 stop:540 length:342 start_codon:yes stop_codon:yes gene_type:complete